MKWANTCKLLSTKNVRVTQATAWGRLWALDIWKNWKTISCTIEYIVDTLLCKLRTGMILPSLVLRVLCHLSTMKNICSLLGGGQNLTAVDLRDVHTVCFYLVYNTSGDKRRRDTVVCCYFRRCFWCVFVLRLILFLGSTSALLACGGSHLVCGSYDCWRHHQA